MDVSGLTALLYSTHLMLSTLTKAPEFALDQTEAKMLGEAIANVSKHYDTGAISQQTLDWCNLVQAAGIVYGPRIFAARQRSASEKEARRRQREYAEAGAGGQPNGATGGDGPQPVGVTIM